MMRQLGSCSRPRRTSEAVESRAQTPCSRPEEAGGAFYGLMLPLAIGLYAARVRIRPRLDESDKGCSLLPGSYRDECFNKKTRNESLNSTRLSAPPAPACVARSMTTVSSVGWSPSNALTRDSAKSSLPTITRIGIFSDAISALISCTALKLLATAASAIGSLRDSSSVAVARVPDPLPASRATTARRPARAHQRSDLRGSRNALPTPSSTPPGWCRLRRRGSLGCCRRSSGSAEEPDA